MACGIYVIENKGNGKIYVGRTTNFKQRTFQHLSELRRGIHYSKDLQEDFLNQCEDDFEFKMIFESDKDLEQLEQSFIEHYDSFNNGYNQSIGGSTNEGYEYSEEWKASQAAHLDSIRTNTLGSTRSEETIQKMIDNNGKTIRFTDEQKMLIVNLRSQGYGYKEIGIKLGCSETPISKFIKEHHPELKLTNGNRRSNNISKKRKMFIDESTIDEMVILRKQGYTLRKIGEHSGYSQTLVTRVLEERDPNLIVKDTMAATQKAREANTKSTPK